VWERERERERDFSICQPVCDWSFYVFFLSSASFLHAVIWRWSTLEQIWSYLCELFSESGRSKLQAVGVLKAALGGMIWKGLLESLLLCSMQNPKRKILGSHGYSLVICTMSAICRVDEVIGFSFPSLQALQKTTLCSQYCIQWLVTP
jgi:hypothetical protein